MLGDALSDYRTAEKLTTAPLGIDNDMQLGISTSNSGLYRNDSGADYPYNIGGLVNITSSSAGNNYYYFYYDIEVETPCIIIPSQVNDNGINKGNKKLIQIKDILGKETSEKQNNILFYIFSDGTVEKRITID